jgi:hypothetical protein
VVVVSPQNLVMADNGAAQALTATGHFDDGSTQDLTASATWTSSNTAVATVDGTGHVTPKALGGGQSAGFTSIKAASGGITGVSILSVTNHTTNASGFAGVFTQHNDIGRTGQNLSETILTPAAVAVPAGFGKKFSQPVDGNIYAQPLYVPNVAISGKDTHNVVFVATENDSVYAFDADASMTALWHANLVDAAHGAGTGATPTDTSVDNACSDVQPKLGVTSTPAIDPSTGTMYVESKSKENGTFFHRLHALDITTGAEKASSPATITATVSGIAFDSLMHTNRPGLLLLNGIVYLAYASDCDNRPYHGWIFAYDAATLSQKAVFNDSPSGNGNTALGGFWMSGAGIAADSSGNIFIASGNGSFDTSHTPATNLGDTNMKLVFTGSAFSLEDYFTPFDQGTLDNNDTDLGSGGVLLLPDQAGGHPHELVQAGKEGTIYVIDRDQMTSGNKHYCSGCASDTQIVQELRTEVGGMWSMPAYWNNNVYFWGQFDHMAAFSLTSGTLGLAPNSTSGTSLTYPGATPSISAHGTSGGIVWAIDSTNYGSPNAPLGPAVLHAYDATNLVTELYSSSPVVADHAGNAAKFAVPTIANGKVYVGTQTELDVYGLLP